MGKGSKVLVVDDEMDICETIRDELADLDVETAYTYEQAKGKLEKGMYDCVVLDIMGVMGFELLEEFGRKFPIIILTGQKVSQDSLKRAIKLNARLYLPKDQLWMIEEYVQKVLKSSGALWGWLFNKVNFSKWFGKEWSADDFAKMGEAEAKDPKDPKDKAAKGERKDPFESWAKEKRPAEGGED